MKCQNCKQHEANFHYTSNVNGKVTEQHLCQECATTMEDSVFAKTQNDMRSSQLGLQPLFSSSPFFGRNNMWDDMTRSFFSDFWQMPQVVMINPAIVQQGQPNVPNVESSPGEQSIPSDAGDKYKKRRELNKLRSEMKAAVKEEKFERAAELRDQIYRLEQEQ